MAAVKKNMVEVLDGYVRGRGWKWGECDCIGLLFHVVNSYTGLRLVRSEHIPLMSYRESIEWLGKTYIDPLTPYFNLMAEANIGVQQYRMGAQVMFAHGGDPIKSTEGEIYQTDTIPGVIFQTSEGGEYALLKSGLKPVAVHGDRIDRLYRYGLQGLV